MLFIHSSSHFHRFRLKIAFRVVNGPEAAIDRRWRHLAEILRPIDISIPVYYSCSEDIPRQALIVFELIALPQFAEADRKRKSVVGGGAVSWRDQAEVT
jgi:hypothetical protein